MKNISKKQQKILNEKSLGKELKNQLPTLQFIGWLRLEIRLNMMQPAETAVKLWYDKFEKQLGFELWITSDELIKLKKENNQNYKQNLQKVIKKRKQGYILFIENGETRFIYKEDWGKFLKLNIIETTDDDHKIIGRISYSGKKKKIKGTVKRIIQGEKDLLEKTNNFPRKKILVANQTTPVFVPAMKKAKAIITDEGGIMSHAAIISRELNIPCIVGTGNATQILKDGDLVEVDADKGVVKIIKKAKK